MESTGAANGWLAGLPAPELTANFPFFLNHYCTYFDHRYAEQGLAMLASLASFEKKAVVWVLALTEECEAILKKITPPLVRVVPLRQLLAQKPALRKVRSKRRPVEFYFTVSPVFVRLCLGKVPAGQILTKLDADLFFYESPALLHRLERNHSIIITPHRFSIPLQDRERFGKFNVGWVSLRNDRIGRKCAQDWEKQCLEWCHDFPEPQRYADQKYLDAWPKKYPKVKVLGHPGANLANWNVREKGLSWDGRRVLVQGQPLVFYHFSGLRRLTNRVFDPQWAHTASRPSAVLVQRVFRPYLHTLQKTRKKLGTLPELTGSLRYGEDRKKIPPISFWKQFRRIVRGDYLRV